ncbi:hypothetical protein Bmyc01_60800 [Bacillus mycoides]|nr:MULTISPECIES: hypothetical protein [Bacillus]MED1512670.1 hypothetical protein [Bacillus proteolyticus]GLV67411.1 hypothetical protein Bmyc01_60800 [Bacillus mycoides]
MGLIYKRNAAIFPRISYETYKQMQNGMKRVEFFFIPFVLFSYLTYWYM